MLTNREKECAELLALGSISEEDVAYLLNCPFESLPDEFTEYVDNYVRQYEHYINEALKEEERQHNEELSKDMKKAAERYALNLVSEEAMEAVFGMKIKDFSPAFHTYVKRVIDEYTDTMLSIHYNI